MSNKVLLYALRSIDEVRDNLDILEKESVKFSGDKWAVKSRELERVT